MSTKTLTVSLDDNHEFRILDNENNQDRRISNVPPGVGEPQTFEELQQRWGLWLVQSVLSAIMGITGHKSLTCKVPDHHWIANRGPRCVNQLSLALGKRAHEKQEPRISAHISQSGNRVLFSVVVPIYEVEGSTEYAHIWAGADLWAVVGVMDPRR